MEHHEFSLKHSHLLMAKQEEGAKRHSPSIHAWQLQTVNQQLGWFKGLWIHGIHIQFIKFIYKLYVVSYCFFYHAIWQLFLMDLFINSTKAAFLCIVCPVWKRHAPLEELSTVLVFLKKLLSGLEKSISTQALSQLTIDLYITFWKHVHPFLFFQHPRDINIHWEPSTVPRISRSAPSRTGPQ